MLVPRSRLLLWVAVLALPFATVAGVLPELAPVALIAIGVLVVAVLFDAVFAFGSLNGLSVEGEETVRLSKDRAGEIELVFKNEGSNNRVLKIGLPLPREVESPQEEMLVEVA